ncbi:MAG: poly-beta-hydroxybutyrate-responsive repressor [Chloroflexi bacterium]|nr:MAG: poly-beta-hydroxybutyrate-responsive repressor [Chloroflexota bacterium]
MPRRRPAPATPPPDETTPPPPSTDAVADSSPPTAWSPRDILIPYVLLAVSLQRAHGYLIEEYLRSVGFLSLEMSTLYRTLRQLEKDGLLHSSWEPGPTGPARRVYSLTEVGRGWLDQWANTLDVYRRMLDQFFGLYGKRKEP